MPERIGFVGLGIMGSRMAANLAAECEVVITMVVDGEQVESVLLGSISPTETRRLGAPLAIGERIVYVGPSVRGRC